MRFAKRRRVISQGMGLPTREMCMSCEGCGTEPLQGSSGRIAVYRCTQLLMATKYGLADLNSC